MTLKKLSLISCVFFAGCMKEIPKWNGKVYKANHERAGLERTQQNEFISSTDPAFSEFLAVRKKSFDCLIQTFVTNCKEWSSQSACGLEQEP